jgi:lysophospholipase L1-like esterase
VSNAQSRFETYVALGDSLTAGFSSGSLVETHQKNSYPALIASVAGGSHVFQQPTVSEPGIPPELALIRLSPSPVIAPKASSPGAPTNLNLPGPYNNLGVPGADVQDLLSTVTDGGGFHDLVLRGKGTALQEAAALRPTFITLWIGNNDALAAVTQGQAIEGVTLTPVSKFRSRFAEVVAALQSMGGTVVAANLPDPTSIPFGDDDSACRHRSDHTAACPRGWPARAPHRPEWEPRVERVGPSIRVVAPGSGHRDSEVGGRAGSSPARSGHPRRR